MTYPLTDAYADGTEYGLFEDGDCYALESGFYSLADAQAAIADRYADSVGITIEPVCLEHPECSAEGCPECPDEDDEDE